MTPSAIWTSLAVLGVLMLAWAATRVWRRRPELPDLGQLGELDRYANWDQRQAERRHALCTLLEAEPKLRDIEEVRRVPNKPEIVRWRQRESQR